MFDVPQYYFPMSQGYLSLVLHAHLPFVRHPEHEFIRPDALDVPGLAVGAAGRGHLPRLGFLSL